MRLGTRLLAIILYLSGVALATSVVASPVRQRFRMDADWRRCCTRHFRRRFAREATFSNGRGLAIQSRYWG